MTTFGDFDSYLPFLFGVLFLLMVWYAICYWRIFEKAGKDGWKCLVPFYNYYTYLEIIGKPWWWLLIRIGAAIIPYFGNIASCTLMIWGNNMLSKSFGKDEGFTAGLVFLSPVFIGILAFGDAPYLGPYGGIPRDDWQESDNSGYRRGLDDILDY